MGSIENGGAFLRLPQVLQKIPVSRSTWWAGVRSGDYPASFKLSKNTTAWAKSDIDALIAKIQNPTPASATGGGKK